MIIVMARQNAKNGGCLVDIEVEPLGLKVHLKVALNGLANCQTYPKQSNKTIE